MQGVYFISGIDTDIGKSVATGMLAKNLAEVGVRVITQKLIQTGCTKLADDILTHRRLMGVDLLAVDTAHLTMPQILAYPASPHLAARLDGVAVDLAHITACTQALSDEFEVVLLEGAGGLMVPLMADSHDADAERILTIDYIAKQGYPVILVTSGRLGSINHTLLSLHLLKSHGISLAMLIYNCIHDSADTTIANDTKAYLRTELQRQFPDAKWMQLPVMAMADSADSTRG